MLTTKCEKCNRHCSHIFRFWRFSIFSTSFNYYMCRTVWKCSYALAAPAKSVGPLASTLFLHNHFMTLVPILVFKEKEDDKNLCQSDRSVYVVLSTIVFMFHFQLIGHTSLRGLDHAKVQAVPFQKIEA